MRDATRRLSELSELRELIRDGEALAAHVDGFARPGPTASLVSEWLARTFETLRNQNLPAASAPVFRVPWSRPALAQVMAGLGVLDAALDELEAGRLRRSRAWCES